MKNRAIFLDRDGIINQNADIHEYITCWREFKFLPGVLNSLAELAKTNYKIIVITNQRGVALGKINLSDLNQMHVNMVSQIKNKGGRIDKVYFCPHNFNECNCRKPLPGMLDLVANEFDIDLNNSWVIGDSQNDIELGKSRGCKTIYIGKKNEYNADFYVKDLQEAIKKII